MKLIHNQSLQVLMERVKDSDQKAFSELYDRLWEQLYVRSYTIIKSKPVAEDIVQEVFIDLWQRRKNIENNNVKAYLYRAVQLKAFNYYRNSKNRQNILKDLLQDQNFESNETEEEIIYNETHKNILQSIQNLSPKCKKVFQLSRINGLKNKEISQQLDISTSTVESHITKAINVLKSVAGLFSLLNTIFFN